MAPCAGVGAQRIGHLEVQRAGEFVFRARVVLAAIQDDAAIKMGLAARQVLRGGECGAGGQLVVGQRLVRAPGYLLGARPEEERAGMGGIGLDGGIQRDDGAGEIAASSARTAPVGQRGANWGRGPAPAAR